MAGGVGSLERLPEDVLRRIQRLLPATRDVVSCELAHKSLAVRAPLPRVTLDLAAAPERWLRANVDRALQLELREVQQRHPSKRSLGSSTGRSASGSSGNGSSGSGSSSDGSSSDASSDASGTRGAAARRSQPSDVLALVAERATGAESLAISRCSVAALPAGLARHMAGLRSLTIHYCQHLTALPAGLFGGCPSLEELAVSSCRRLEALPESLGELAGLRSLSVSDCARLEALPPQLPTGLRQLSLRDCRSLARLPDSLGKQLRALEDLTLCLLWTLRRLPGTLGRMAALRRLRLHYLPLLEALPERLDGLTSLEELSVLGCTELGAAAACLAQLPSLRSSTIHL